MYLKFIFFSFGVAPVASQRCSFKQYLICVDHILYFLTIFGTFRFYSVHFGIKNHATDFAIGCTFPLHEVVIYFCFWARPVKSPGAD